MSINDIKIPCIPKPLNLSLTNAVFLLSMSDAEREAIFEKQLSLARAEHDEYLATLDPTTDQARIDTEMEAYTRFGNDATCKLEKEYRWWLKAVRTKLSTLQSSPPDFNYLSTGDEALMMPHRIKRLRSATPPPPDDDDALGTPPSPVPGTQLSQCF